MEPMTTTVISPEELLKHWQGHRQLTRRMIEAFPEDKLFNHSIGGMRTFAQLVQEFLSMSVPTLKGVATGKWETYQEKSIPATKAELLKRWDEDTTQIESTWASIPPHRFQEIDKAFGQWEGPGYWILFYVIDNEIHHRGQAYVYLRSLGIEPPPFWER